MDEPGACYIEWSKSEKQILYINAYIWNLEKWYWLTYLQGRNREAGIEKRLDTAGEGKGGTNWDSSTDTYIYTIYDIYILPCVKQTAIGKLKLLYNTGRSARCSVMTSEDEIGGGWSCEGGSRGKGYTYTYGWLELLYGRTQDNIVKQLSSDEKS